MGGDATNLTTLRDSLSRVPADAVAIEVEQFRKTTKSLGRRAAGALGGLAADAAIGLFVGSGEGEDGNQGEGHEPPGARVFVNDARGRSKLMTVHPLQDPAAFLAIVAGEVAKTGLSIVQSADVDGSFGTEKRQTWMGHGGIVMATPPLDADAAKTALQDAGWTVREQDRGIVFEKTRVAGPAPWRFLFIVTLFGAATVLFPFILLGLVLKSFRGWIRESLRVAWKESFTRSRGRLTVTLDDQISVKGENDDGVAFLHAVPARGLTGIVPDDGGWAVAYRGASRLLLLHPSAPSIPVTVLPPVEGGRIEDNEVDALASLVWWHSRSKSDR